jgi:hypothetical protein
MNVNVGCLLGLRHLGLWGVFKEGDWGLVECHLGLGHGLGCGLGLGLGVNLRRRSGGPERRIVFVIVE